ncbi:tyrosine-type recombinase/integrase [Treponema pectinovorum]|uniref:tyrosine-type recombinase/integrase n=1 Tax=Treponema pectinovorum TaxID=164 RepID=UPI0011C9EC50|nr:tyrosine-type recombinase/integrase [Treponema pectinovorum]
MRIKEPFTIFKKTLKTGKKVYYYQFRRKDGSRSCPYSTGQSVKSKALNYVLELWKNGEFEKKESKRLLTFAKFSQGFFDEGSPFLEWKKLSGRVLAPETIDAYKKFLNNQVLPYFAQYILKDICVDDVKNWIIWMNTNWSKKTSNNAQSVFNIIMKSAKEKRLIDFVPSENLAFRKVERKERQLLTIDEIKAIYNGSWRNEYYKRAFLLLCITGMRIGEVIGLLSENVFDDRLNVCHTYSRDHGLGPTKTRVNRFVPIPKELKLKQNCGSLWAFPRSDDKPILANEIYKQFRKNCDNLGIERELRGLTVHSLRNHFISYMRASRYGFSIDLKIKAMVGHTDNTMTDWYTYWTPEMMSELYELQKELFNLIVC